MSQEIASHKSHQVTTLCPTYECFAGGSPTQTYALFANAPNSAQIPITTAVSEQPGQRPSLRQRSGGDCLTVAAPPCLLEPSLQ